MRFVIPLVLVGIFVAYTATRAVSAEAQVYYDNYTPHTESERIAYLHGIIAQLLAQLGGRSDYVTIAPPVEQHVRQGQVLGVQAHHQYQAYQTYNIDVGTGFVFFDDDEDVYLNGTIDIGRAPYADVWFEYGDDRNDMDSTTRVERFDHDGRFDAQIRNGYDGPLYYRAVAQSPSGVRDYGVVRYIYVYDDYDHDRRDDDDAPDADTFSARDVDEDSAELRGEVDMNDFRNGVVFFVYGEDEDEVDDVDREDRYADIDERGDDLRKVRVDSDLDGRDDYERTVTGLDDDTQHYFRICVEYEDEDDDEALVCGDVEDFETDRD